MQISSVSNASYQPAGNAESFNKMKQLFDKLGSAMESGNLSDAKDAMTELQKYAPKGGGDANNPMKAKMDTLSKALESGDLESAQAAYADVQSALAQRPQGRGAPTGRPSGPPPDAQKQSSSTGSSSSSNQVYDKMDLNKDGNVSATEEILYKLEHPDESTTSSGSTQTVSGQNSIDVTA